MKTTKIRQSAKGQHCQGRIAGYCNGNPETVVLAHRNGGGMGMKNADHFGAYLCSGCHSFCDGGWTRSNYGKNEMLVMFYEAIFRTQKLLIEKQLLIIKE